MAGFSLGIGVSVAHRRRRPSYDPFAAAYFGTFQAEPGAAYKRLMSDYTTALQDEGIWPKLDLVFDIGAMDATGWARNWKDPDQFMLAAVNGPTIVPRYGATGDGSTMCLEAPWTPFANGQEFALNDASIWMASPANVASAQPAVGAGQSYVVAINPRSASDNGICQLNSVSGSPPAYAGVTSSVGFWGAQLFDGNQLRMTRDGIALGPDLTKAAEGRPTGRLRALGRTPSSYTTLPVRMMAVGGSVIGKEQVFAAAWKALADGMAAL